MKIKDYLDEESNSPVHGDALKIATKIRNLIQNMIDDTGGAAEKQSFDDLVKTLANREH